MKHSVLFAALGLVAFGAAAQEVGNVISATPVVQQVTVPRQTCAPGMVQAQPYTSGMGGLAGGITGAALGSAVGHGSGTAAAMLIGTIGGALLGNSVEANNMRAQQAATPTCTTENTIENRTVGYDVVYEYGGRQYATRLPYDPGPTVRLQVSPVAQGSMAPSAPFAPAQGVAGTVSAPPVQGAVAVAPQPVPAPQVLPSGAPQVLAAPVVVQPYPAYPAAAYPPAYPYPVYPAYRPYYYPPVGVSLGFVFSGHGHGRWR
ncbi:hypothetical protein GCM10028796_50290 [Ramlibacter monticola]|uniref:Glycine zipper 2TM domain-containing protein n=1 Tax=Ramlibacter monticola TaxID=1926872 RepID=A0A936YWQ3_9BURK|nr:glycine zipper 2TM domain-containing protein [Ramlibacter monticola]MBL0390804.1 hypothetical protein [Ramlibacter monticola]